MRRMYYTTWFIASYIKYIDYIINDNIYKFTSTWYVK